MLESLLLVQKSPPVKVDIAFKTSGAAATITTSQLGSGFTTQYSIDGADFVTAGTTFSIPAGNHEVALKLDVTTGAILNMQPFAAILTEVTDWDGFQLENIRFVNCTKLIKVPDYLPPVITDTTRMFSGCSSFNWDISGWNVSQVTNMVYMFYNCSAFNQNIGNWDTSQVTNTSYMFHGCSVFNQNISLWNVSKVANINFMFQNCISFNQDLSSMVFKSTVNRNSYDSGATAWNSAYRPKFTG